MGEKHKSVKWMLKNPDKYKEEDISQYVIYTHDSDNTKARNIEDLISTLIKYEVQKEISKILNS